ncbi:uncharacterized protein LOC141628805 [Silene latifolia]|uniref:uncharacterized protein LOC141628805 n=1 Tax=Silene latifolia TaxID=37657 RepID=UPI003D76D08D
MKEIGGLFNKYFSNIFKSNAVPECFEDYIIHYGYLFDNLKRKVGMEERAKLGRIYSKIEVRQAVFQLGPLKSPGPDGIPAAFYQKYWSIVKDDVINGALNILNSGTVLKEFNKTFIVLIPKNNCPESVEDFRPISLCNVIMKVVTKCIANRLKGVMDDLVSPFQSAFVPNRSIADNIVIAQEILHVINHRSYGKKGMMALKADMSKAYDRLNWNFIRGVLSYLNLPDSMVHLIMSTIESVSYEILINGAPMENVEPCCGIRQGDPLSPYIFALCTKDFLSRPVGEGGLGLLNIGCFNQALLAKSAWRILCDPGSLISKVIGPKLGIQDDILFQNRWKAPHASSWALKSLVWASDLIYNNIAWTIGSSSRLNAWKSKWIEGYSLHDLCGDSVDAPTDSTLLVGDLYDTHRRWDLSSLGFDPGERVTKKILATYISCQPSDDSFYWKLSKYGDYTVKSGYYAAKVLSDGPTTRVDLSRMSEPIVAFCKSKLWKLPISDKLRVFLWKFMANALPVGSEFLKRKMNWRSSCTMCDGLPTCVESISHLFRDCSFAKALWNDLVFRSRRPWPMAALNYIVGDIQGMNEVVCDKDASLLQASLLDFSSDFGLAKRIRNSFPYWIVGGPVCGNVCTVKCDAAWRDDRSSGMGWCLLDGDGTLRNSANARSFASSALHAEGQVAGPEKPITSFTCIIQDIKSIASHFHCCSLSFCPRGVNRIAHNLAQQALL